MTINRHNAEEWNATVGSDMQISLVCIWRNDGSETACRRERDWPHPLCVEHGNVPAGRLMNQAGEMARTWFKQHLRDDILQMITATRG